MEPTKVDFHFGELDIAPGRFLHDGRFLITEVACGEEHSAMVRVRGARGALEGSEWMVRLVAPPCRGPKQSDLVADHHPNVLPTLEHWEESCSASVPPTHSGIRKHFRRRAKDFDRESAMRWLLEVAEALTFVHSRDDDLIHGHLRPESAFLSASGSAMLEGIGCSGRLTGEASSWFFAPERSSSDSGSREDDVWALGLLGLQLLLRLEAHKILPLSIPLARRPALVHELVTEAIGVDAEVGRVLDLCLFERAADRPSASFVARALRAALAERKKAPTMNPETGRALHSVTVSQERASVPGLLELVRHPSSLVCRAASLAIVSLARGWSCEDSALTLTPDEEAILCAELARCLEDASAEVVSSSLAAIRLLARTPAWRTRLVATSDLLPRLMDVLGCEVNASEVEGALGVLSELTSEEALLCAIHQVPRLVARLVRLLGHEGIGARERSAAVFYNIANDEAVCLLLRKAKGLVAGLVSLLADPSTRVREVAAETLRRVAWEDDNQVPLRKAPGLVERMVSLLADSSARAREAAAWALRNLACANGNKALLSETPGLAEGLVALLADASDEVREAAVWTLRSLVWAEENKVPLRKSPGLVAGLVTLLVDAAGRVREGAAVALESLAWANKNKVPLRKVPGLVERMVSLLADDASGVRKAAARALESLAWVEDNAVSLQGTPGLVSRAVGLLEDSSIGVREAAAWTLHTLAWADDNKIPLRKTPGLVAGLVSLLADSSAWTHEAAAGALQSLAQADDNKIPLREAPGLMAGLVSLLADSSAGTREAAARTLQSLAQADDNKIPLREAPGLMAGLVSLLADSSAGTREAAAAATVELARDSTSRIQLTLIPSLFNLLKDSSAETRQAAAKALGSLATEPVGLVSAAEVFPRLIELLEDVDEKVRKTAAESISAVARHRANRERVVE